MADTLKQLETDLENLNAAIRSGVLMAMVGGQQIMYQSMQNMQVVASDLERRIAECKGIASQKPRVSSIDMSGGV